MKMCGPAIQKIPYLLHLVMREIQEFLAEASAFDGLLLALAPDPRRRQVEQRRRQSNGLPARRYIS
jgi:hypothetical protein